MQIWHFHPETGALIGAGSADPNPLEQGGWLIPAFATPVAPPEAEEHEVVLWVDGAWVVTTVPAPPPPPPPPPPPVPNDVSFWQFMLAAKMAGFITHAEAMAALQQRVMPAVFANALVGLPQSAREEAEIKFAGITRVQRADPLFDLLLAAEVVTTQQLDAVFTAAAQIT